jgi:tetratricopeptide (TPR) repeat protein
MRLKSLILTGLAGILLMYATGCGKTVSPAVRDGKSKHFYSNRYYKNQITFDKPAPVGDNGDADGNPDNGGGDDPLTAMINKTIDTYNTRGEPINTESKKGAADYIVLMGLNLEKLAREDLSGVGEEQKTKLGEAFNDYGVAHRAQGDSKRALFFFTTALNYQRSANIYSNMGVALCDFGRFSDALGMFDKALELDPNHVVAKKWRPYAVKKSA